MQTSTSQTKSHSRSQTKTHNKSHNKSQTKSHVRIARLLLAASGLGAWLSTGCRSDKASTNDEPTASGSASARAAAAPANSSKAVTATPTQPTSANAATCPAGRWRYDYSDQALEVMLKNVAGAKVIKEEGEFTCEITPGKSGTITCDSHGKPVINVVETKQAGMPMTISVTLSGKATTRFELIEGQRMKVVSSDTSGLKIDTTVKLGGKELPFPTEKLVTLFGKPESLMSYKCEGGDLSIKPELANVEATWQRLTPVK